MSGSANPLKRGRHRKPSTSSKTLARTVIAGAVVSAPLATAGTAQAASDNVWDRVAQCESGGNWTINTGNGFQGGLQFTQSTWHSFGGSAFASSANRATRSEQIAVAEKVLAGQGWGAWPVCSRKAHATGQPATPRVVSARSIGTKTTEQKTTVPRSTGRHALRPVGTTPLAHPPASVTPATPAPLTALPLNNPTPTPAAAPIPVTAVPAPRTYQVHQGDTLSSIARKQSVTGGWQAIYNTNRNAIGNANLIHPGQQLTLS